MSLKKVLLVVTGSLFLLSSTTKTLAVAGDVEALKRDIVPSIRKATDPNLTDTEDPEIVFERAIEDYQTTFPDYIDISALNVSDREVINLPNFDAEYETPSNGFGELHPLSPRN